MPRISQPTHAEYLAIDALSSSRATLLLQRCEAVARARVDSDPTASTDRGAILHRLLLGRGQDYELCDFPDWRTNAAKSARDAARAAGKIPVLTERFDGLEESAAGIRGGLLERGWILDGRSELAIEWEERAELGPVPCKAMLDHLLEEDGCATIIDLKIVEDASPDAIERSAERYGYAVQAAAYTRALTAARPELAGRILFLFAFCEPEAPFAMSVRPPDGIMRELGDRRWCAAVSRWGASLASGIWPGYPDGELTAPPWVLAREGYTKGEDF